MSDVWLYTSGPTPDEREWDRLDATVRGPFPNPADLPFEESRSLPLIPDGSNVDVRWHWNGAELLEVELFVDGTRSARLVPGAKPGCREWHDVTAPALAFCSVNAASRTAIDRASACPSERHGEVGVNPRPAHASGFYVAATAMASISICSSGSASEVTSTIVSAG